MATISMSFDAAWARPIAEPIDPAAGDVTQLPLPRLGRVMVRKTRRRDFESNYFAACC